MKENHYDINGDLIELGDVVVIHNNTFYDPQNLGHLVGAIGIVEAWGCCRVNYGEEFMDMCYFNDTDLEVIGTL